MVAAADGDQPDPVGARELRGGIRRDVSGGLAPSPGAVDSRAGIAERLDHRASSGLNLAASNAGHVRREPDHAVRVMAGEVGVDK